MKKEKSINEVLFQYVTEPTTWFYWYHNPNRLQALYEDDHKVIEKVVDDYHEDNCCFTKKKWRFKSQYLDCKRDPHNKDEIKKIRKEDIITIEKNLYEFFNAVLDEVRIKKANAFAKYALHISDNEDLAYFRDTVTRREISEDIDYNKQRDHAVHTLYNYILGWYIFENSSILQGKFETYFITNINISLNKTTDYNNDDDELKANHDQEGGYKKFCKIDNSKFRDKIVLVNEFADVWKIASLLHDIGYILEGNISSADPEVEHTRIINGSSIIHDYFNHYFWEIYEIDFRAAKNIARKFGIVIPDFKRAESLSSLGDHLCDIGSCENIRKVLINSDSDSRTKFHNSPYRSIEDHGLNREAISIWKEYYELNDNKKMQDILYIVNKLYKRKIWVGSEHSKRNLDHGVCSGLIVLQALTFSHELFLAFCNSDANLDSNLDYKSHHPYPKFEYKKLFPKYHNSEQEKEVNPEESINFVSKFMFDRIGKEIIRLPKRITIRGDAPVDVWFMKLLWATASTAIHSIIQDPEYIKECKKHINLEKMKDEENNEALAAKKIVDHQDHLRIGLDDPLAFLGVLVDVLQEWDRYTVKKQRGETAFTGFEPLQGIDVGLTLQNSKINLIYPEDGEKSATKQIEKLTQCLKGWKNIIFIEGYDRNNSS